MAHFGGRIDPFTSAVLVFPLFLTYQLGILGRGGSGQNGNGTGYGPGGATPEVVALLRAVVGGQLGVKASGGVRTAAQALALLKAGASRIGASASVAIVSGGF